MLSVRSLPRPPRFVVIAALSLLAMAAPTVAESPAVSGFRLRLPVPPPVESVSGAVPGVASAELRPLAHFAVAELEAPRQLAAMLAHNARQVGPVQTGFVRRLDLPGEPEAARLPTIGAGFSFGAASAPREAGTWRLVQLARGGVWAARVRIDGAYALRLRLESVRLPPKAQIWLIADAGDGASSSRVLGPYGRELLDGEGGLWLPAAPGPEVAVEVHFPRLAAADASEVRLVVADVAELFDLRAPWIREETKRALAARGESPR